MDRTGLRRRATGVTVALLAIVSIWGILQPESAAGELFWTATETGTIESSLRLAVPIALTAIGGLYAEKSGIINIGLEGLLIISAFVSVLVTDLLGPGQSTGIPPVVTFDLGGSTYTIDPGLQLLIPNIWVGLAGGVVASMLLAFLFGVICIRYQADQIIAGLAVWLIALGLAPFAAKVVYGQPSTAQVGTFDNWTIPVLSEIPVAGEILFDASPMVIIMLVSVPVAWYGLNRTSFGYWVRASGENPKALDTVGVNVDRVRYAAVLISGFFSGIGGTALSLGAVGSFSGAGQTMVDGRGFIAIAAYLFGNYNPFGAFAASYLFSGLQALQIRLQGIAPTEVFLMLPYLVVVIVLVLVGRTRLPEAAGEHYESGED
ncbi:ABC transporter permease [Haloarchaeobius iranensis]|uniref:Nucleoside ABC transporter membrane protein n=1 Tax=Haloarchaeobius iranensis TaxID=996166 RepID=A0A1G9W596_9EURY|nr:ABC transporter permease [Haloarchaeobius iranensis]SDM79473.1 nucleoside ABC transporter membrane protein [Haloarchaeobius iranensis]